MNTYRGREEVVKRTEELFEEKSGSSFQDVEKILLELGFIQRGADPSSAEFQHTAAGLMLDVEFNDAGDVHAYELLNTEDIEEKQRKFRW